MRLAREVALAAPVAEAWHALLVLPPARGSAAGYDGTAVLEDADDERRTATVRLQGAAGAATVAATATVTVLEGRLAIAAEVRHGLGGLPAGEKTAEDALGHLATTLAYALATARESPPPAEGDPSAAARESPPPAAGDPSAAAGAPPLPAIVRPAEVLTARPRDVVHPGQAPPDEEARGRWVRAGVAAAAGIAVLRILRGRR